MSAKLIAVGLVQAELKKARERFTQLAKSSKYHYDKGAEDERAAIECEQGIADLEACLHELVEPQAFLEP